MSKKKYIETPERLWELFAEYKQWVKNNPILVQDFVGKNADEVRREKERPLTKVGFENYVANQGIISDLSHYFCNLDKRYSEYVVICSRIIREIQEDQINGGMVGIYNPSITQRLNNLTERTDVTTGGEKITGFNVGFTKEQD